MLLIRITVQLLGIVILVIGALVSVITNFFPLLGCHPVSSGALVAESSSTPSSKVTSFNEERSPKAMLVSIVLTDPGIVRFSMPEQSANAPYPMLVTLLGMFTLFSLLHPLKAPFSIVSTVSGMEYSVNLFSRHFINVDLSLLKIKPFSSK